MAKKLVTIEAREVGQALGCTGVIRDARTGKKIGADLPTRPYGFSGAALADARAYADAKGWSVVEAE